MASQLAKRFELLITIAAVIALALIVREIGLDKLRDDFARVGLLMLPILALEIGQHVLNTLGLLGCFPRDRKAIGFIRGSLVRLAGETVNMTTPTATVGGEVIKVTLLARHAPARRIAASVSQAYASQMLAQMIFIAICLPLSLPILALPFFGRVGLALAVLGGLVFATLFMGAMRAGPYGFLHGILRRVGLGREGGATHVATQEIDGEARELARDTRAFGISVCWFVLGWAWGIIELALIAHALGVEIEWRECLAVESLAVFSDAIFFFVPSQVATREGGLELIFRLLGRASGVGISIGLVRRARQIVWAVIGLGALMALKRWDRGVASDAAAPSVGVLEDQSAAAS